MFPFREKSISELINIRTFNSSSTPEELIWHRDKNDRLVRVLKSEGWYLQMDDELPVLMQPQDSYTIKKNTWHRVIRKTKCSDLIVEIINLD